MTEIDSESTNDSKSKSASLKRGSKTTTLILAGLIVLLGATSVYLYTQNRDVKKKNDALAKKDPQKDLFLQNLKKQLSIVQAKTKSLTSAQLLSLQMKQQRRPFQKKKQLQQRKNRQSYFQKAPQLVGLFVYLYASQFKTCLFGGGWLYLWLGVCNRNFS